MSLVWIERISPHGRAILADVMRRCGVDSHTEALESLRASLTGEPNEAARSVSRQARHAQLGRARSTAAAGAVLLAASDDAVLEFVCSADFVWLRPFTVDIQFKWRELTPLVLTITRQRCARMFEIGARLLLDLATRAHALSQPDLLRMHNALLLMYMGPLAHGRAFADAWDEVWEDAYRRGLLQNRHLLVRLGTLGNWTGSDEAMLEGALDQSNRDAGMADGYCFVRTDTREDVYAVTAAMLRGDHVDPTSCLSPTNRASTVRQAIDYVRASFRDTQHLRTAGQALYLLTGLSNIEWHVEQLQRQGLVGAEVGALIERMKGFERVQFMEKGRFWPLCDRLPEGASKQRLIALWQHEYGSGHHPRIGAAARDSL